MKNYKNIFVLTLLIVHCTFSIGQTTYAPPGKYFLVLKFNQAMDTVSLKDKTNYLVFDQDMNELEVLNTGLRFYPGTGICADSSVVLLINAPNYKTNYIVRVGSVYGKNGKLISDTGNSMWYYFDGYDPNEPKPYLMIK